MSDDPSRFGRQERRRRRAERRRRRREDAEDVAEAGGDLVDGAGDVADLAGGGVPTPGFGGGRGGGRCDGCDGFGRGGGGGRGGGTDGCDGCDCNLSLLHLAVVALLAPVGGRPRVAAGRRTATGLRLSTLLRWSAAVLPAAADGVVAGRAVTAAVGLYRRRLSRFTPACPGHPSCSAYALDAVTRLGARGGLRAAAVRLRGCGPDRPAGATT